MKQELIVKSNILLQQPLYKTSVELKIFSRIILAIRDSPDSDSFTFQVKNLLEIFDIGLGNYGELKKVAKNMFRVVDLNPDSENFHLSAVFTDIYVHEQGLITFEVNKNIKPYLLNLTSNFTQYYFENIARLKSSFSIRIYELLKQYEKIGVRTVSIIYLRKFLNISNDKFTRYNDFKRKVLFVAQKELKEKTDLYFEFEEIKTGRKITEIKFSFFKNTKVLKENGKDELIELVLTSEQEDLKTKLVKDYGVSEKVSFDLVSNVGIKQIEDNIIYTQKEFDAQRISKNFTGFLIDSIKNNYAGNMSLFEESKKKKKASEKRKKLLEEKKEKLTGELSREFSKKAREEFVESLSENEKQVLLDDILKEIELDTFAVSSVKKMGLSSPSAYLGIIKRIDGFLEKKEAYIQEGLKKAGLQ